MFGTKWPSITSTCSRSHSGVTFATSSARCAKSAARIDGAILRLREGEAIAPTLSGGPQDQAVHAVGVGGPGEQPGTPPHPHPGRTRRLLRGEGGEVRRGPLVDGRRLGRTEGAHGVHEPAAGRDRVGG